jgi:cysteinyl-tRNA synthetase
MQTGAEHSTVSIGEIERRVKDRLVARQRGDTMTACRIQDALLRYGIRLVDYDAGTQWIRNATGFVTR